MKRAKVAVTDIENKANGDVIAIGSRILDDTNVHICHSWGEWLTWLESEQINKVYAHNGGGWDWLSLLNYLMERDIKTMQGTVVGNRLILMILPLTENHSVALCDSWCLWQTSLDKIAKVMIGRGKVQIPELPEQIYQTNKELFYDYLINDVNILADCLIAFNKTIKDLGYPSDSPPVTIASCALRTYLKEYALREINPLNEDTNVNLYCRQAYHGGRVYPFRRGLFDNVNVFDINSLYPTVMRENIFPYTDRVTWTNKPNLALPGVFHIKYSEPHSVNPPFIFLDGKPARYGEGYFYTPEINRLIRLGGDITVLGGFNFVDYDRIFTHYVDTMYKLKQNNPHNAIGAVAKMMMNHLYGKFGEKPVGSKFTYIAEYETLAEKIKDGIKLTPLSNDDNGWYMEETERQVRHGHVGIAGMVTSYAWVYLHERLPEDTIYIDTDSIHIQGILPTGVGLGELKLEKSGQGVYIGKKLYAIKQDSGKVDIKAKGVSLKSTKNPDGADITFADMVRLLKKGESHKCTFFAAPTLKETLKGAKPCRLGKNGNMRTRTLQLT